MKHAPPNQTLHLTGAARLVFRNIKLLQRPWQVSFSDRSLTPTLSRRDRGKDRLALPAHRIGDAAAMVTGIAE
jgi:hypothetical protein